MDIQRTLPYFDEELHPSKGSIGFASHPLNFLEVLGECEMNVSTTPIHRRLDFQKL